MQLKKYLLFLSFNCFITGGGLLAQQCDSLGALQKVDSIRFYFDEARQVYKLEKAGKLEAGKASSSATALKGIKLYNKLKLECVNVKSFFSQDFLDHCLIVTREIRLLRPALMFQDDKAKLYPPDVHDTQCKCGKCPNIDSKK